MTTYTKKIILLSASLLVLAACTGADRPSCWKANTKGDSNCNSSNGGGVGSLKIGKRTNVKAEKKTNENTPSPDVDTPDPEDNSSEDNNNQDTNPVSQPNQSNSNDIEGYDPFGGLYGPGT